jgi:hypothetical protein
MQLLFVLQRYICLQSMHHPVDNAVKYLHMYGNAITTTTASLIYSKQTVLHHKLGFLVNDLRFQGYINFIAFIIRLTDCCNSSNLYTIAFMQGERAKK